MLTFVADYSPEPAPAPAQFRIETGNDRSVDLEDVRQLGMHALTGSILLDSSLMKVGALSFHGLGLPEARIVVR
jgi:hypothetical protein